MIFAVIGGDMRQAKLAELLQQDGHTVRVFAFDRAELHETIHICDTVRAATEGADCVVLPLPVSRRDGVLNTPLSMLTITLESVFGALDPGQTVCAGRIDQTTWDMAARYNVQVTDYFAREELAILNAVATAEGALQLLMEELPVTLWGLRCLVIGYGRLGKLLSYRLHCLGADVTVSARKWADLAWIRAMGYTAAVTPRLDGTLDAYDAVINTVPAQVLNENRLRELKPGCLCLDLASKPGGMDFAAASRLGVRAVWALSLPGEVAPVTSGAVIRDTIYHILEEREQSYG
jgi:dipicolinate synthase subunit A